MMPKTTDDAVRNLYRRHYASYIRGRRINLLTLEAEAWFWRLHDIADDFGNLEGDPLLCYARTVGGRRSTVTPEMVEGWIGEMITVGLIVRYEADAGIFLHFLGFTKLQPAGKNGRRVRQFPSPHFSEVEIDASSLPTTNTTSKGIQGNPGESNPYPYPISHIPVPITHEPSPISQPPADPGGTGDEEIAAYFRNHPRLIWSPIAHSKMRQLVGTAGWDQAKRFVDEAVSRATTDPVAYALKVCAGQQAKDRLDPNGNGKYLTAQEKRDQDVDKALAEAEAENENR